MNERVPERCSGVPLLSEETSTPEAMVRVLESAGIEMVFGMPGGETIALFRALYDHQDTIRTVLVREEAKAGVMAEVYGRMTGRPGVVIGQGAFAVNANFGAIEAHMAASPMLILTDLSDNAPFTLHAPYQSGAGDYGGWDARRAFESMTKRTFVARGPTHAVQSLQLALKHAVAGEPGPVAVVIHSDSWRGNVGPDSRPTLYADQSLHSAAVPVPDDQSIEQAVTCLVCAARPVVIAGNGVRMSGANASLHRLAHAMGVPVASSAAGKGVLPETDDWALGVYGTFGTALANAVVAEADVLLVVGSKLGATDTAFENPALIDPKRQRIVQIDVEPTHLSWTFPAEVELLGDAAAVLDALTDRVESRIADDVRHDRATRLQSAREQHGHFDAPELTSGAVPVLPQRVIKDLREAVPDDAIITCDAGENRLFMMHYFQTKGDVTFVQPAGIGAMGYAIPAALAAKLVYPDRAAVAVCGDGGFPIGMNGLMTAVEENLPIVTVVLNNRALGWVKHGQGEYPMACDFEDFDYAAIARSMGCVGYRVTSPNEVLPTLREALASDKPAVVDVCSSIDESYKKVTSPLARK